MESDLIRSAQAGDQQSWATLKDSVAAFIQEKISESVASGMDAADADGEAALLFVEAVNTFNFSMSCRFLTHLNQKLKALKHADHGGPIANGNGQSGRAPRVNAHMPDGDDWAVASDDTSVDDADELEAVHDSVEQLPERMRAVINGLLAYRTHAEIAEELGVSVNKVKQLEAAAHKRLRGMLK